MINLDHRWSRKPSVSGRKRTCFQGSAQSRSGTLPISPVISALDLLKFCTSIISHYRRLLASPSRTLIQLSLDSLNMSEAPAPRADLHKVFQASSAAPDRLIHLIPDQLAEAVPDHILFSFPRTPKPEDGFIDVSCKSFANGVNRTSWWLESVLGEPQNFDTVGYIGSSTRSGLDMHM